MKNFVCILALSVVLFFAACKKEKPYTPPPVVPPVIIDTPLICDTTLIISTYQGNSNSVFRVYSADRKLQRIVYPTGAYNEFTYGADYIQENVYISGEPMPNSTETFTLNSQGYVSHRVGYVFNPEDSADFYYDSDGYLIFFMSYLNYGTEVATQSYAYTAGNLVSTEYSDHSGVWSINYEYYTDKENFETDNESVKGMSWGFDNWFLGMEPYYGKRNKNLLKSMTISNPQGGSPTVSYSYELDSAGRITKKTTSSPSATTTIEYINRCH